MKRLPADSVLKRQLISQYLLPTLGLADGPDDKLTVDFAAGSHQYEVVRYEDIGQPGPWDEGIAFWSERALLHAYYYCTETLCNRGLRIYRRYQLIVDTESLLYKNDRAEYLQALERGGLIGISYPNLRSLMRTHPSLHQAIQRLHRENEQYYRILSNYLVKPAAIRFREFTETNWEVASRISHAIRAMHVQVSNSEYYRLLKKWRE